MNRILFLAAFSLIAAPAAFAADVDAFVAACTSSSNLDEEKCRCTGDNARKDLTADGFDYLVALLNNDKATIDAKRPGLGMEEQMKATLYMTKGPAKCAAAAATKE